MSESRIYWIKGLHGLDAEVDASSNLSNSVFSPFERGLRGVKNSEKQNKSR
jgi:hypothetical protein